MPAYKIILESDTTLTILNTPITYKKGRHTVSHEELVELQTVSVVHIVEFLPNNALMIGNAQKNGYKTGAIGATR